MPTAAERNALLFLAAVAVIGGGVRVAQQSRFAREVGQSERLAGARTPSSSRPDGGTLGDRAITAQTAAIDSARAATPARRPRSRAGASASRRRRSAAIDSSPAGEQPRLSIRKSSERAPLLVDINRATRAELERLPRVGPALAQRIIDWREQHGPYHSIDDLRHVRGIGPATAALLAPSVTF